MFEMNEETFQLIKKTTELQATSSAEHQVREFMRDYMTPLVDKIQGDGLGSIFGIRQHKDFNAPRIMLAAHMDEVGFMVKSINDQGLIKVVGLGGWNPHVISAQRFTLQTRKGDYPIISSSIPPHQLRGKEAKAFDLDQVYFDAGFTSKDEAEAYGVRPGDTIVPDVETIKTANGKRVISKAFDNRYGVSLVLEVLDALKDVELPYTLIAGATVQEEVGLRGAKSAVHKFNPDVFLAVDASPADDVPVSGDSTGKLGDGFLLRVQDPGMITPRAMRTFIEDTAEAQDIPYQHFFSKGGTDAVAAHVSKDGIPSAVIGVPARYIHTHQSLFDTRDYEAAKHVLINLLTTLDKNTVEKLYQF